MNIVKTEVSDKDKKRLREISNMLATSQKDVVKSMVMYCLNEDQENWRAFFVQANIDGFEIDTEEDDDWDASTDLNEAIRPESPDDVWDGEEQFDLARDNTEEESFEDVMDDIDDL